MSTIVLIVSKSIIVAHFPFPQIILTSSFFALPQWLPKGVREADGELLSLLAMRQAISDVQRKLAAILSGYIPTENPYIVKRAGKPEGKPQILNTRVLVEYIANYFNEGWGVGEIQREFPFLTREEIEAAIQYYLNHKEEIDRDREESERMYRENAPKGEVVGIEGRGI
jgi:uncharacterized protein (DUF433 family)